MYSLCSCSQGIPQLCCSRLFCLPNWLLGRNSCRFEPGCKIGQHQKFLAVVSNRLALVKGGVGLGMGQAGAFGLAQEWQFCLSWLFG
jgi:hypothetical protein